jgi:hypothetical protein
MATALEHRDLKAALAKLAAIAGARRCRRKCEPALIEHSGFLSTQFLPFNGNQMTETNSSNRRHSSRLR